MSPLPDINTESVRERLTLDAVRERVNLRTIYNWVKCSIHTVLREIIQTAVIFLVISTIMFTFTGLWPPLVAIESGSMEPNIGTGDIVLTVENTRYLEAEAHESSGVVTHQVGETTGYETFNQPGDVIVFYPFGDTRSTPIIHRAMFHVEEGENWYAKANPEFIRSESCDELIRCPAPNAGFITKGDANPYYDQANGANISTPVHTEWIEGKAKFNIPYLGEIRLRLGDAAKTVTEPALRNQSTSTPTP